MNKSASHSQSARMQLLVNFGVFLGWLANKGSCDDTVADDIGSHMMGRIAEQLTPEECQDFYTRLTTPEKDIEEELDKLSEKNNPIKRRRKRDIVSKEQCLNTLEVWLEKEGDTLYWDQLSRALSRIGRADVARELSKNLNQDKNLEMRRYVEGFPKSLKQSSSLLEPEEEKYGESNRKSRDVKDVAWEDWELIIEREKLPPYDRSLLEWAKPVAFGIVFGFLGATVLAAAVLHITIWLTKWDREVMEYCDEDLTIQKVLGNTGDASSDDTDSSSATLEMEDSLDAGDVWTPHTEF
ncbi:uncharacterized protein C12orf81-like isoform X3 [Microcaecilia unicolor]|uniref:Uncharacterized protein C12orf81-like isoform X3 n=2 Tax=Microcaecilia unicolor TaxID=1415580 RepID=A0A6P7ZT29_9AMPH|nr:uncharacterized protein C12orf81-like isoform X3 [Microcaecilia unicolor]